MLPENDSRGKPAVSAILIVLALALMLGGCASGSPADTGTTPAPATSAVSAASSVSTVASSGTTTTSAVAPQVIRIGALFPLTGDLAKQGEECLEGMRLAVDEVNGAGGIHSLGGARVELAQGDSQGDSDKADAEFARLVTEDQVVAVVGAYQSSVALPAGKRAEDLKTPFVVSSGAADEITERGLAYTFRLCPKASWYARDQVRFIAAGGIPTTSPITKVALLHEDGEFGSETASEQRKYLDEAGIEVVDEIAYPVNQPDFSEQVLRIKSGDAQAVLAATYLNDAVLIADSAHKLRLAPPILDAGGGTADAEFLGRTGETSSSIITEFEYVPGSSAAQVEKAFADAHAGTVTAAALYSYQAVWLVANALERVASTEHERLRAALATTAMTPEDHMVLPQTTLSFDAEGQNRAARLFVAQIQNSKYVPVWPTEYAHASVVLP